MTSLKILNTLSVELKRIKANNALVISCVDLNYKSKNNSAKSILLSHFRKRNLKTEENARIDQSCRKLNGCSCVPVPNLSDP